MIERGLVQRSSEQRQQLLGCLSCRWNKAKQEGSDPVAYGFQAIRCANIQSGVIYPLLQKLEDAGVVTSSWEDLEPGIEGRPPRRYFQPAATPLGEAFAATLQPPLDCPLEQVGIVYYRF